MPADEALDLLMPAEWAPHEATWIAWPHNRSDWPGKMAVIPWVYGEIVRYLTRDEQVRILVPSATQAARARKVLLRAGADLGRVQLLTWATNRGWTRDYGPIFSVDRSSGKRRIVDFKFNAWARYPRWQKDNGIPARAAKYVSTDRTVAEYNGRQVVLEGGAIDVNGCGTLLTTEECLLDAKKQVRNPGFSAEDYEQVFRQYFGVHQTIWLGKGIVGDDTHGHVDDICRFVNETTVVLVQERDPQDANYRALAENRERLQGVKIKKSPRARPTSLTVIELPMPAPLYHDGVRLPASYANFYISNAAILVPTFNDPQDRVALGILADVFTDRPVIGIHAVDLVLGLGTLHCLTQQEPAG